MQLDAEDTYYMPVCTICGELKGTHVRPRGCALAISGLEAKYCVSTMFDPNIDDFASTLNIFVNSEESSLLEIMSLDFLLPTNSMLLPIMDDWTFVISTFAQEVFYSICSILLCVIPLSKSMEMSFMQGQVYLSAPCTPILLLPVIFRVSLSKLMFPSSHAWGARHIALIY